MKKTLLMFATLFACAMSSFASQASPGITSPGFVEAVATIAQPQMLVTSLHVSAPAPAEILAPSSFAVDFGERIPRGEVVASTLISVPAAREVKLTGILADREAKGRMCSNLII